MMTGICGDFDGNRHNDFITSDGTEVGDNQEGYRRIGDSWQVEDREDPRYQTLLYNVCKIGVRYIVWKYDVFMPKITKNITLICQVESSISR